MNTFKEKMKTAIKLVFDDINSMTDEEFYKEVEKYRESELTSTLLKANAALKYPITFESRSIQVSRPMHLRNWTHDYNVLGDTVIDEISEDLKISGLKSDYGKLPVKIKTLEFTKIEITDDYCPYNLAA